MGEHGGSALCAALKGEGRHRLLLHVHASREDGGQLGLRDAQQLGELHRLVSKGEGGLLRDNAQGKAGLHRLVGKLEHKGAVGIGEQIVKRNALVEGKAEVVAKAHFHHGLGHPAKARGVGGAGAAAVQQLCHGFKVFEQGVCRRQAVGIGLGMEARRSSFWAL